MHLGGWWRASRRAATYLLPLLLPLSSGCFYYDSTWGQSKVAQQNAAQHYSGKQLGEGGPRLQRSPGHAAAVRRQRIVAFATPQYAGEIVNWQARFQESVQRANQVLEPALGLELEVVIGGSWRPEGDADHLEVLLAELERTHAGAEGDWVVGLVGSLSRLESSFHAIGMARLNGRHLVLRAANDALEFDAIERSFTELGTEQRAALYRSRRAHQASAVLIHELGHCLGAVHVTPRTDLMHSSYDNDMVGLDEAVLRVLRIGLAQRELPAEQRNTARQAAELEQAFELEPAPWDPEEKAERVAYLASLQAGHAAPAAWSLAAASAPVAAASPAPGAGDAAPALGTLSELDRAVYQDLLADRAAGRLKDAWSAGQDLFHRRSDLRPVAELRCQLAMDQQLDWQQTQAECAPLMQHSGAFQR